MREVVILFLNFEHQALDRNIKMLGQGFLEIDQLQIDAVAIVKRIDLVDAILKMDLVLAHNSGIGGAGVGDDVDIIEFQIGLLETKSDGVKVDAGG